MPKIKIAILGASGMLGSMLVDYFSRCDDFQVLATTLKENEFKPKKYPKVEWQTLDASSNASVFTKILKGRDWIINAIGIIKPYIKDDDPQKIQNAVLINAIFPHNLATAVEKLNIKVIQIATDCVWDGRKGKYLETDPHDPVDVYGKTKSLGEVYSPKVFHLRSSIIGPEQKNHFSLMDWFLFHPKGAKVDGYINHQWNGITTLHFAKICEGIIRKNPKLPHIQHIIPADSINKAKLFKIFAAHFDRQDIKISFVKAKENVDRTLETINPNLNKRIWRLAGYKTFPTVEKMVSELAEYLHE